MPTGYTFIIEEGCSFAEYAWGCARAFGALVTMRDAAVGAEIPGEFKPAPYYKDKIQQLESELRLLCDMSLPEIKLKINAEHARIERENKKRREEFRIKMERYSHIKAQVEAWEPPTPDHVQYKDFMLEQINISSGEESPYQESLPKYDAVQWKQEKIAGVVKSLTFYKEEHAKEVERVKERNAWVNALRESIPQPTKKG